MKNSWIKTECTLCSMLWVISALVAMLLIAAVIFNSRPAFSQTFEPHLGMQRNLLPQDYPIADRLQIPPEMCIRQFQAVGSIPDHVETHWVSMCNFARIVWLNALRYNYQVSVYTVATFSNEPGPVAGFIVSAPTGRIGCFFRLGNNDIFGYTGAFTTFDIKLLEGYRQIPPGGDYRLEFQNCLRGIGYYNGLKYLNTTTAPPSDFQPYRRY